MARILLIHKHLPLLLLSREAMAEHEMTEAGMEEIAHTMIVGVEATTRVALLETTAMVLDPASTTAVALLPRPLLCNRAQLGALLTLTVAMAHLHPLLLVHLTL